MSENNQAPQDPERQAQASKVPDYATYTAGQLLGLSRRARGLTFAEVASALYLSEQVISKLEADDYSSLGPAIYVRGYLKAYANLLDINEKRILAAYSDFAEPATPVSPKIVYAAHPSSVEKDALSFVIGRKRSKKRTLLLGAIGMIAMAAFGIFAASWYQRHHHLFLTQQPFMSRFLRQRAKIGSRAADTSHTSFVRAVSQVPLPMPSSAKALLQKQAGAAPQANVQTQLPQTSQLPNSEDPVNSAQKMVTTPIISSARTNENLPLPPPASDY